MNNYEKMLAGEPYTIDQQLIGLRQAAASLLMTYNTLASDDAAGQRACLQKLMGELPDLCFVLPPLFMEFGRHVRLGEMCFVNTGAMFLDNAPISLGDRTAVGPNVQFITATHPVRPEERLVKGRDIDPLPHMPVNVAQPITIGRDCWIGAGVIILPGVTIGEGTTVGAGAVVTKSLPADAVAVGNPARVVGRASEARSVPFDLDS